MREGILVLLFWMDACAPGQADQGDPARGEQRFAEIGCNGCHTVAGVGGMVGPDLTHIGSAPLRERGRWSSARAYIKESIRQPQAYLVPGYPGDMPSGSKLGLTARDLSDLVAYLLTLR
jgi:mono/diheme cytochrome c family protein